jgi:DNA-directed RNA polymerase specialized sigma24 family protein
MTTPPPFPEWRDPDDLLPLPGVTWTPEGWPPLAWGEGGEEGYTWFVTDIGDFLKDKIASRWRRQAGGSVLPRRLAEELTQVLDDVLMKIWNRWSLERDPGRLADGWRSSYAGWLSTVCRSTVIDRLRQLGALARHDHDATAHAKANCEEAFTMNPTECLETEDAISRVLGVLSTKDRELLGLLFAGLSAAEIAILQGRTEDAVRSHRLRLFHKIREALGGPDSPQGPA